MDFYSGTGEKITFGSSTDGVILKAPWDTVIHRGWISGAHENTLPAFYLTKENGYDWAECDVRFSSDGVPVLAHNSTITSEDGTTVLTVAESTFEELKAITLATSDTYGEIKMATLKELLEMARLIGLGVLIDVKSSGNNAETNMKALGTVVLSSGWSKNVVYMPGSVTNARSIQSVDRNASFDFVTTITSVEGVPSLTEYQSLLTGANTVGLDLAASITDENGGLDVAIFDAIRSAGLSVSFWNVRASAYKTYMDACPLRITKQNTADKTDLDALYLATKQYYS